LPLYDPSGAVPLSKAQELCDYEILEQGRGVDGEE
jgi:hypothetical protein